jgi:hypothetical protein
VNQYTAAPLPARFWEKVAKTDGCWYWLGARISKGYGTFRSGPRIEKAHRYSWQLHFGPIPAGLHVLHHCDVPACVRPAHLWLGTNSDNMADRCQKGRQAQGRGICHSRLTVDQVHEIRARAVRGNYHALAREYGVDATSVGNVVRRETWRSI